MHWVVPIAFGLGTVLVLALGKFLVGRALVRVFGSIEAYQAFVLDHAQMIRRRASPKRLRTGVPAASQKRPGTVDIEREPDDEGTALTSSQADGIPLSASSDHHFIVLQDFIST
jgi:hypothetical protein